jgi:UDP-glucose 4-epimerase
MRVAVVGASGNAGTALLRALAAEDAVTSVLGIARRLPRIRPPKVEWAAVDISRDDLLPHFAGADCVVHLAWLIQPSHDRKTMWLTNVQGSRRVFDAAAAASVPAVVYASSVGTYSPGPKDRAVDESWETRGISSSFYSRDKAEVERILDAFEDQHPAIRVVRIRPSILAQRAMGTEVTRLFTGRLVPRRLISPSRIPFVPDLPRLRFQITHSDDVADAYRRSIVGDARGAFNIAAEPVLDAPRPRHTRPGPARPRRRGAVVARAPAADAGGLARHGAADTAPRHGTRAKRARLVAAARVHVRSRRAPAGLP